MQHELQKHFFLLMITVIIKGNVIAAHCEELLLTISHFDKDVEDN